MSIEGDLNRLKDQVVEAVRGELKTRAQAMLNDMKMITPIDPESENTVHAKDALEARFSEDGLRSKIGLFLNGDDYRAFWFRFLDGGTKEQTVLYRRGKTFHTMKVPFRRPHNIIKRVYDLHTEYIQVGIDNAISRIMRGRGQ